MFIASSIIGLLVIFALTISINSTLKYFISLNDVKYNFFSVFKLYPTHLQVKTKINKDAFMEKSTEGDYAISRELNDLSYTFVFPAGTTRIECKISLDGENNWTGFNINSTANSDYWEKDADGNIDYSKPLTFYRDEATAERDEYGVLYRDFLKDAQVKGFRDYSKLYGEPVLTGEDYAKYMGMTLSELQGAGSRA